MNFREIEWCGVDWINLAQDRDQWRALVNTVMKLRVSWKVGKFLNSWATGGFSRRSLFPGLWSKRRTDDWSVFEILGSHDRSMQIIVFSHVIWCSLIEATTIRGNVLSPFSGYLLALKMKVAHSFEKSPNICQITRVRTPERLLCLDRGYLRKI
jgi:hypothetical protein